MATSPSAIAFDPSGSQRRQLEDMDAVEEVDSTESNEASPAWEPSSDPVWNEYWSNADPVFGYEQGNPIVKEWVGDTSDPSIVVGNSIYDISSDEQSTQRLPWNMFSLRSLYQPLHLASYASPQTVGSPMSNVAPHFPTTVYGIGMVAALPALALLAQSPSAASTTSNPNPILCAYSTEEPDTYIFQCCSPVCGGKTFGRWPDFTRHYNGAHATTPKAYWCAFEGCSRSKTVGDDPFPRKDKLNDHVRSMHRSRSSG